MKNIFLAILISAFSSLLFAKESVTTFRGRWAGTASCKLCSSYGQEGQQCQPHDSNLPVDIQFDWDGGSYPDGKFTSHGQSGRPMYLFVPGEYTLNPNNFHEVTGKSISDGATFIHKGSIDFGTLFLVSHIEGDDVNTCWVNRFIIPQDSPLEMTVDAANYCYGALDDTMLCSAKLQKLP